MLGPRQVERRSGSAQGRAMVMAVCATCVRSRRSVPVHGGMQNAAMQGISGPKPKGFRGQRYDQPWGWRGLEAVRTGRTDRADQA